MDSASASGASVGSTSVGSADAQLDLRGTPWPLNFVRTKLKLEKMQPGSLLEVWLDPGEPIEQVPDSLRMDGYGVEAIDDHADYFSVSVRRPVEESGAQ